MCERIRSSSRAFLAFSRIAHATLTKLTLRSTIAATILGRVLDNLPAAFKQQAKEANLIHKKNSGNFFSQNF